LALTVQLWPVQASPDIGVSFSTKYSRELGIEPKAAFTALLSEMGIKKLRLMSYWDEHEPAPGQYNFDELDWLFDEAKNHGAKISLAVGLRQPRWPECHEPEWAKGLGEAERNTALQRYIDEVVNRYKSHPALVSWQLENEAQNRVFGNCTDHDRQRIINEYQRLKQLDTDHPVIMSLSDQHGLPVSQPVPDIYGISVYRVFYNKLGYHGYITYPTPQWYHRLRKFVIEKWHNRPVIIHELQMEPWGPRSIPEMDTAEQNKSMDRQRMQKNFHFGQRIGTSTMYLWGAEWWYWRMAIKNDPSIWDTAKKLIRN